MSKMNKITKIVIFLLITSIVSATSSYTATNYAISANSVGYSDNSNLGADNVQAAIDGTCTKFSTQLTEMRKSMEMEKFLDHRLEHQNKQEDQVQ